MASVFLRSVFLDVDGVLIDSLPQHLQICRDKAVQFGLRLSIPTVKEFRQLVSRGTKVSPMVNFFRAVGFPNDFVQRAVDDYEREFFERYRPQNFEGVKKMLGKLQQAGLKLGLVTSNTRANVEPVLGDDMRYFENSCQFFLDSFPEPKPKSWCLDQGAHALSVAPSECVYVGDQPADAIAAKEAGFRFLGVTYGWGILKGSPSYQTVESVSEISDKLIHLSAAA